MSNMSYCRFQNTLKDLADCREALEALFACDIVDDDGKELSEDELRAAFRLVEECQTVTDLVRQQLGKEEGDEMSPTEIKETLKAANDDVMDAVHDAEAEAEREAAEDAINPDNLEDEANEPSNP